MPVLRRLAAELRASLESPTRPLTDTALLEVLGPGARTDAGPYVSEKTALRVIAVYRAVSLLAGTMAALPLKAYRGQQADAVDQPLLDYPGGRDPVTGIPFPGSPSAMVFWETTYAHLLLWGNAYLVKVRTTLDPTGGPVVRLEHLRPDRVAPKLIKPTAANPAGKVFAVVDEDSANPADERVMIATPRDVLHIPAVGFDGCMGVSPIGVARQGLGMALAAEEYGARLFGSGSLMSGILQTDAELTQPQAEALKERWTAKITGLAKAHEVAVLDSGAKWQPVAIPPQDSQFIESRKFQVVEIARLYGIPPHMLGDVERSTSWGAGIEQQGLAFIAYTLRPWLARVEQAVSNELLPRGTQARFVLEDLLRGDITARYAAYATGITNSVITVNEARAAEGLQPVPGGGRLLMQANLVPFSTAQPKPPPAPATTPPPPPEDPNAQQDQAA
jgi:HK97 family phage portal protein